MHQYSPLVGRGRMRVVMRLSWPVMIEQLLLSMAGYIDTAMVGSIGVLATAAVAVNASTTWLINGLFASVGTGFTFLVARSIGAEDYDTARSSARHAALGALLMGLLITLLLQAVAGIWPKILGAAQDVAPLASSYLRIIGAGLTFQSLAVVFSAILRGAGDMKTPMGINLIANLINITVNLLLIFPTRPVRLPIIGTELVMYGANLGVQGAAIGTTASYLFAGVALLIAILRTRLPVKLNFKQRFRLDRGLIKNALRVAVPTAMERSFLCFGQIALTAMITRLGTVQIAAHNLAVAAESISYLAADGFSKSATTLVGQSLGAKKTEDAEQYGKLTYRFGFLVSLLGGILLFTCAEPLMRIFTADPLVIEEGRRVLRIVAAAEPFFGLSIVISGALYGAGDSGYVFLINAVGMWGIRLGLAWLLAYPLGLGLSGAWIAMAADLIVRGVLFYIRFRRGKWKTVWRYDS